MAIERKVPGEIRIFLNHVYEFKKGVRNMVLYTMNKEHEAFAIRRLERQNISYLIQEVNANKINLFFKVRPNVWMPYDISLFGL